MITSLKNRMGTQAFGKQPWCTSRAITIPQRRSDIRVYQIDGEAVLFDPKTHTILQLNLTALAIFRRCDGKTTMRQVAESLAHSYNVTFDNAHNQVEQVVSLFASSKLLDVEDGV